MTSGTLGEGFIRKLCISCTPRIQFLEFAIDQFLRVRVMQHSSFLKVLVSVAPVSYRPVSSKKRVHVFLRNLSPRHTVKSQALNKFLIRLKGVSVPACAYLGVCTKILAFKMSVCDLYYSSLSPQKKLYNRCQKKRVFHQFSSF